MTLQESETNDSPETVDLGEARFVRDPFDAYRRLRERGTMAHGVIPGVDPLWVATSYEDVRMVMSDPRFVIDAATVPGTPVAHRTEQTWQARGMFSGHEKYLRAGLFDSDGPDHRRLRGLVSRAFSARRIAQLRPRIEAVAEELLDRLPGRLQNGSVDLVEHFARPLPITVICELIAVPEGERDRWRQRSTVLTSGVCGPELGDALGGMVHDAHELVERHRARPGDDLISELIGAQDADGDRMTTVEMVAMIVNLVVAGHVTTVNLIANGTAALLTHPDQLARLRAEPDLMPDTVDELMRWCGPVVRALSRYATADVRVGDTPVSKGDAVLPILCGANCDPRAFTDPDQFDITRAREHQAPAHLGFGHGPHRCLGAQLAQLETELALTTLLHRFPNLTLAADPHTLERGTNPVNWHLKSLPVAL